jgi:hypothetical protein
MKKLAFGALMIGLLATAACGGGHTVLVDANGDDDTTIDAAAACNPVAQTGCADGEKCSWVFIDSTVQPALGEIKCVPDGAGALGAACMYGADGEGSGYDDCAAGGICISGACESSCTTSPDSCDASHSCQVYDGIFPDMSGFGACDPLCNPVTQEELTDPTPTAVCGGTGVGIAATRGCYGVFDSNFSCAGVPATVAGDTGNYSGESDEAYGPGPGMYYLNGCAPGYSPLLRNANDAQAPVVCMAFCQPAPTDTTQAANLNGAVGSGYTCGDRDSLTQSCTYFWVFETVDPTTGPKHPDGVGYCWTPGNYVGDWDNDVGTADSTWPLCSTIAPGATGAACGAPDGADCLQYFGCQPFVAGAAGGVPQHAHPPIGLAPTKNLAKRQIVVH